MDRAFYKQILGFAVIIVVIYIIMVFLNFLSMVLILVSVMTNSGRR